MRQAIESMAAAWRLERKFPERWGRCERHQVEANIQGTVKVIAEVSSRSGQVPFSRIFQERTSQLP